MSGDAPAHTLFFLPSVSHVLKGEQALLRAGITCRLVPVPRDLGSQCGVCLRVDRSDRQRGGRALAAADVPVDMTHDVPAPARGGGDAGPAGADVPA